MGYTMVVLATVLLCGLRPMTIGPTAPTRQVSESDGDGDWNVTNSVGLLG
jgi:hypothetical protein